MHQPRRLRLTASIMLCFVLQALGADKYTDENRPYEFGFKIDGEQHRHESKDKDGIIMGEFGFVTADDVYHVTVYATDKEGRFKILSMKNIHLKSSSTSSLGAPIQTRQGHALALPPAQGSVASQPGGPSKPVSIEPPGKACSSCSLPTTTPRAPPPAYNQVPDNNNYNGPNQFGVPGLGPQNQQGFPPSSPGQLNIAQGGPSGSSYSPQGSQQNYPSGQQNIPEQGFVAPGGAPSFALQPGQIAQNYPGSPSYAQGPGSPNAPNNYALGGGSAATVPHSGNYGQNNIDQAGLSGPNSQPSGQSFYPQGEAGDRTAKQYNGPEQQFDSNLGPQGPGAAQGGQRGSDKPTLSQPSGQNFYPQGGAGDRTAKQYNGPEQQFDSNFGPQGQGAAQGGQRGPDKPTLFSAQMQIVDKNTDVNALGPNEHRGLPPGLTHGDMTQLLYTFNYTLGFHGHFEEGYTNGVKQGYYFITGRNGVRTRIDYVADDTGFHPKVSQDVLDLLSEDVPKPETEKDEKYGLKGYEFKWLYYPVESKKR